MFPIVPYNFSSRNISATHSNSNYVTDTSKLLVPGKVIAATNIPQGAMSVPIEPAELLGERNVVQLSVEVNSFGLIVLEENSKHIWSRDTHWVRALRLSDDCNSYNIQLRFQPSQRLITNLHKHLPTPKLVLQTVRPITSGQELLLWFSEEILAILQIVFLTPANIQGQKKYACTQCSALFESPNPLKLHITLICDKYGVSMLWEKLSKVMGENTLQTIIKQEIFDFKLSPQPHQLCKQRNNAIDLSITNNSSSQLKSSSDSPTNDLYKPYITEPSSAFKPFKRDNLTNITLVEETNSNNKPSNNMWPTIPFEHDFQILQLNNNSSAHYEDEAHIETLVSSLGRSKQGHICLYCGKCYSRKYGLKIHIRTHTGYKPLKCKFCMRPFGDPSNLNKHVRLHAEGNTPYKCDLCGKILVRRRDLDRHLKSRHMIEMHPGLNILENSNSLDEEVEVADGDSQISSDNN